MSAKELAAFQCVVLSIIVAFGTMIAVTNTFPEKYSWVGFPLVVIFILQVILIVILAYDWRVE